jgi:hypothetical protein
MKMYQTAALALILATSAAPANATVMVLGVGTMTCSKAMRLDWNSAGITSWIQGYITAQEGSAVESSEGTTIDFLPGKNAMRVVALVMKQCQDNPDLIINDAAAFVAARLVMKFDDNNVGN